MLLPQIRAATRGVPSCLSSLESGFSSLRISSRPTASSPSTTSIRHASHQAQGRANGPKDGAGKRLGAKKTGEQYVIPGNIIFRQRGTKWFPGDNCAMGRDHTIYATQPGYVKYYRDPRRNPDKQYIGVVFERAQTLPQPPNAVRRRKLGMLAYQMPAAEDARANSVVVGDLVDGQETGMEGNAGVGSGLPSTIREAPREQRGLRIVKDGEGTEAKSTLTLRPGYQYRQANWEIGRAAERAGVQVKPFKPRDRYTAWRKTNARKAANAEKRSMRRQGKSKK